MGKIRRLRAFAIGTWFAKMAHLQVKDATQMGVI